MAFKIGGVTVAGCGSVAVHDGMAQCMISTLPLGSYNVSAAYSGDGTTYASSSSVMIQRVVKMMYYFLPNLNK